MIGNKVISFLGSEKDNRGFNDKRWNRWRPNVSLCMQDDFFVSELTLLITPGTESLANFIVDDIKIVSSKTKVTIHTLDFANDPWDFANTYSSIEALFSTLPPENDYFVNISTGTHATQFSMASLVMNGAISAKLIQVSSNQDAKTPKDKAKGGIRFIDFKHSRYDRLVSQFVEGKENPDKLLKNGITTRSPSYNKLINKVEMVAVRSDTPILITGETGAGKTQLASQVYTLKKVGRRINGDFISVNCATLNGNTEGAKSALFGHAKGAFTGANSDRKGFLTLAHNGVLFLDEIGTLGMEEQGMLLHALEHKEFYPLGKEQPVKSNFTLICGTNDDLKSLVTKGMFRADLLSRINLWDFKLPSLRDRIEDIEPNVNFELTKQSKELGHKLRFNAEAEAMYISFAKSKKATWLGNFRDLSGSISRMATLSNKGIIDQENVLDEITRLTSDWDYNKKPKGEFSQQLCDYISQDKIESLTLVAQNELQFVIYICQRATTQSQAGSQLFFCNNIDSPIKNPSSRLANYLNKFGLSFSSLKNNNNAN